DSRETSAGPSPSSAGPVGINAARPLPRPPLRSVITALLGSTASQPTSLFSHHVQPVPWLHPHNSSHLVNPGRRPTPSARTPVPPTPSRSGEPRCSTRDRRSDPEPHWSPDPPIWSARRT